MCTSSKKKERTCMNYDRIILELMNRVSALEQQVSQLREGKFALQPNTANQQQDASNSGRDKTKYIFNGVRYGKNRLVLAVIKDYCARFPYISVEELMSTFDKSLQGSHGVVRFLSEVKECYVDYEKRFFCQEEDVLHVGDQQCVVSTQWGVANIGNFIARAKQLGIQITII